MARTPKIGPTQSAYAEMRGITPQAVTKMVSLGKVIFHEDGSVNVEETDRIRATFTRGKKLTERPPDSAVDGKGYNEWRTENEALKAKKAAIELEELQGLLVRKADVDATVFRLARQERDAWVNWPNRVAALIAARLGVDPAAMHRELTEAVRQQLEELAVIGEAPSDT